MNFCTTKPIAIIGAGTIGLSLAQLLAQYEFPVVLIDTSIEILEIAKQRLKQNIKEQQFFSPQLINPDDIFKQLEWSDKLESIAGKDYVFENITENLSQKLSLYAKMKDFLNSTSIIAVNTSSIPIFKLASTLEQHAPRVIGMHFINPVPLKKVAEMIPSQYTSQNTIDEATALLQQINIRPVMVKDRPGFVINRILMSAINQAIKILSENIASTTEIDDLMISCLGHSMGPLATADLIGLDTVLYSLNSLYNELNQDEFKPASMLVELVKEGALGRKTRKGFYNYYDIYTNT